MNPSWLPTEEHQLRTMWGKFPLEEISAKLGRNINSINHKASRLGIAKPKPRWTQEELDFLEDNWGRLALDTICRRLGRPRYGVIDQAVRVQRLGPTTESTGRLTAMCLARELGVSRCTVLKWLRKFSLPHVKKVTRSSKKVYQIEIRDWWKWAEQNQHRFDSMRFEPGVMGAEPNWMREKRRQDYYKSRRAI